jgi:hypothetical protein
MEHDWSQLPKTALVAAAEQREAAFGCEAVANPERTALLMLRGA